MDVSALSDQQLVDGYTEATADADLSSPAFSFEKAAALANELETRGFTESSGTWHHPDRDPITPTT